jgi:hypothetical protein
LCCSLVLFSGAVALSARTKAASSPVQVIHAACLIVVVLTHVCEALNLFRAAAVLALSRNRPTTSAESLNKALALLEARLGIGMTLSARNMYSPSWEGRADYRGVRVLLNRPMNPNEA